MSEEWIPANLFNEESLELSKQCAVIFNDDQPIPKLSDAEIQALIFGGISLLDALIESNMSITEFVEKTNFKGF